VLAMASRHRGLSLKVRSFRRDAETNTRDACATQALAHYLLDRTLVGNMSTVATIDPNITMRGLLVQFPGAQRALFRKYHIGGCSSCGFSPEETLAGVCARNENLSVDEVAEHIIASHEADVAMQIEPRELADRIARGEKVYLLDVRTREEWEAVKLADSHLFTQELMQEILANESKTDLLVIYDHKGARSMDAAAYFQGHGFENVKSLRGGIDAWSADIDATLPRYHLE
jgi:rhodanese-related sulfurtransferase